MIDLTFEQHEAPEVLFNSQFIGRDEGQNVQDLIFQAIEKCEVDCRVTLSQNVVLSGGSTMFKGFTERLKSEVSNIINENGNSGLSLNFKEKPCRRYMSWIGAAILASLSSFESKWITKSEY